MALIRASYHLMRKVRKFRYLPFNVKLQRKLGDDKSPSQTAVNIPRTVPRSPWKNEKSVVTPSYEAIGGSHLLGYLLSSVEKVSLIYPLHASFYRSRKHEFNVSGGATKDCNFS